MRLLQTWKLMSRFKVVVFDSAVEGFFLTHYDFLAKTDDSTSLPPGPTGLQPLPDMLARLSRAVHQPRSGQTALLLKASSNVLSGEAAAKDSLA
jgi:hypothetical protein